MESNTETNNDCLFCGIVEKRTPSHILFENDNLIIIPDIMPKAPVHVLVISKRHIVSVNGLTDADKDLIADMILSARNYTTEAGIDESGYKLVFNSGKEGGQIVPHFHMHLLGGKQLDKVEV